MRNGPSLPPRSSWAAYCAVAGPGVTLLTHWGVAREMLPASWSDVGPTVSLLIAMGGVIAYHVDVWRQERQERAKAAGDHPPDKDLGSSPAELSRHDTDRQG